MLQKMPALFYLGLVAAYLPNNVQTSRSKKLHHYKSQASINNGSYNQGSYYRNAKSAAVPGA